MEKIDLTGWKELDNTEVGTYLNDKKDSINTSPYDDATDTKYDYETQVEKKARPDYFGKTEITGELKTIMRNPVSSFGRGAWNNVLGLGKGVAEDVVRKGETLAEMASYEMLPAGAERYKFNQKLEEGANNLSKKVQDWFAQYETTTDERDRVIPTEIGSVTGSLFSSVGLTMLTKSPTLVAEVFGSSASGEYAEELRNKGVNVFEAQAVASGLGAFQGITEQYGADKIVDAFGKKIVVDKLVKNKIAKYIGKTGAIEGLEEIVQQGAEETVMNALDYRDTPVWDSVKNVLQAGALGFVGGAIGGGISLPFVIKTKENTKQSLMEKGVEEERATTLAEDASFGNTQAINEIKDIYKEDLKKQLKDKGKTEEEINEFVDGLDFDNEETQNEIADFINKEAGLDTLVGDTYEADVKRFNDEASLDVRLQAFDIKDQVKEQVMKVQGMTEQAAEGYGVLFSDFSKVMYEIEGVTPAEQWQDKGLNIIDERMANEVETQDIVNNGTELTEDDLERLGVTEEELEESPMDEWYSQPAKEYRQEEKDIADRDLVALHSISASNLEKAIDLGGFPVPSIAIVNKNQEFHFGGQPITLVGNKEMIDPYYNENEVYNRDVWSKTFPQTTYKKPTSVKIEKFKKKFAEYYKKSASENELGSLTYSAQRGLPQQALSEFVNSSGARLYYLENIKRQNVEFKKKDLAESYLQNADIDEQTANEIRDLDVNADREKITQSYLGALERKLISDFGDIADTEKRNKYMKSFRESWAERLLDDNGLLYFGIADKAVYNANKYFQSKGRQVLDYYDVSRQLKDMTKDDPDYQEWAKDTIEQELLGEPMLQVGNKILPYSLENIVDAMVRGSTVNSQESLGLTSGKIIAAGAKKLESITDIKEAGKKLVSYEQSKKNMEEIQDQIHTFTEYFMTKSDFMVNMDRKEASGYAIADIVKNKNIKKESLQKALNKELVEKTIYPDNVLEVGVTLANNIKNMSRYYFEAKPQRAVGLKEFSAAIIPTESKYDAIAKKVEDNGLKVVRSDNQQEALQQIDAENEVFFQDKAGSRGAFTPTQNLIELFKTADSSTLVHELGHFFTINYIKACKEYGQEDRLTGIYQWLGVKNESEMNTEHWERLARAFETYAMEGQAPNIATQTLFQKMKKWLLDVYEDIKGTLLKPEEINNDVREFFDRMFASEEVDVSGVEDLLTKIEDVKSVVSAMQRGEDVSIGGISKKDIIKLDKVLHARLPREPRTLMDDLMSVGIEKNLAKSFDLKALMGLDDVKKGGKINRKLLYKVKKLFPETGGIDREDSLIDFLMDNGYLDYTEIETYEQKEKIWDKAISLLSKANKVYTPENMEIMNRREELLSAMSDASNILSKVNYQEVEKAIKTLKTEDIVAVDRNSLKYLKEKIKGITKDYNKIVKSLTKYRDTQESKDSIRKQLADYIKNQPLSAEHKVSLTNKLNKADTLPALNKVANAVYKQATRFYESEQKKIFVRNIERELKKTKPTSAGQRYNYETNKLFVDIRKYSKMTKAEAESALNTFEENDNDEENILRKDFLSYKAHGMESSVDMLEEVLNGIQKAKYLGEQAKNEKDFNDRLNNEQARQDILEAISKNKADKNKLSTQITNLYRRGFANLYSLINSISSKELAEKYQFETLVNDADKKIFKHTDNMIKTIMDVLGLKRKSDFLNIAAEMNQKITTLYNLEEGLNQKKYDLSRWDIIDIYLGMKNENTREQFIKTYGEEQINNVLGLLSPSDIQIAEIMFNDIQPLYEDVNKVYIRQKGMDLLKVENYWPRSSEHKEDVDIFNDFKMQSTSPSFTKERATNVEPLPKNAWSKYLRHINESYYLTTVAEKQAELKKIWSSSRVENAIVNKFGQKIYDQLASSIDAISMNGRANDISFVDSLLGKGFNNFVVAKIALAPTVFVGQLTSVTNYAENIKSREFYKYFAEGLRHPKQTVAFMKQVAGAFLDTRYHGGFNETVSNALRETENVSKQKFQLFSVGGKYNYTNALTSWVRTGDIGAIIFGGYAQIKANLESGKSLKEAVDQFEFDTLRSQQSSNAASLSSFQRDKGLPRLLLAFKNTQHQYLRKMVDAAIQYQRGEISLDQAAKIYMNYAVLQPALYVLAKNLTKEVLGLFDDDDSLGDGLIEQLLLSWTDAIPLFTEAMHYVYRKATDQYTGNLITVLGADDLNKSAKKLAKENKSVYDWAELISPLIEATTSTPVSRAISMTKKYMEE